MLIGNNKTQSCPIFVSGLHNSYKTIGLHKITHIVSLLDYDMDVPKFPVNRKNHIFFKMRDIVKEQDGAPRKEQLVEFLNFTKTLKDDDRLLVHCHIGYQQHP